MPGIDNLSTSTILQLIADLKQALKDLSNNTITAPYQLTVGAGGLIVQGTAQLQDGLTVTVAIATFNAGVNVTGGLTADSLHGPLTGNVTGNVAGTISNSGANNVGSLSTSSDVVVGGNLYAVSVYNTTLTSSYRAVWSTNAGATPGQLGYVPSSGKVKRDLQPFPDDLLDAFLQLQPRMGRFTWDADDAPLKTFLIAEEVQQAGFADDVAPPEELIDGQTVLATINYDRLTVPLLAGLQRALRRIDELETRNTALEARLTDLERRLDEAGL